MHKIFLHEGRHGTVPIFRSRHFKAVLLEEADAWNRINDEASFARTSIIAASRAQPVTLDLHLSKS